MSRQNDYKAEYEKYKDVELVQGKVYAHKNTGIHKFRLEAYDRINNVAILVNIDNGHVKSKTAHWARKHLRLVNDS